MRQSALVRAWIGIASIALLASLASAQTTAATTTATTTATTMPADAVKLGEQVTDAYGQLKSLVLSGTISANIDIAGQQNKQSQSFKASYAAPGKYRHALGADFLLGSTGSKIYAYDSKDKTYVQVDAPAKRGPLSQFSIPVPRILDMQNPSLLLAIADNTFADLLDGAKDIHIARQQAPDAIADTTADKTRPRWGMAGPVGRDTNADTTADKTPGDRLTFTASDGRAIAFLFDAKTHLLRQARYDLAAVFIERGAPDVKSAVVMIDYAEVASDAPVDDAQFAWAVPEGAREQAMGRPMTETSALEGQPAPDFKLKGLDGKEIQLASLKNQVIVLDFWATWCPPCVASLPDLNALYEQRKAKGLQAFAINLREELADVKAFVAEKKLTIPVLLDPDGAVGDAYGAQAIPQTVVIGKDGKVKKVFVGIPPGGEADIARAVDAAMGGK